MNLLIIGNGFDLAHDLPTQYKDFLKFVNLANAILDDDLDTIKNIEASDGNDDNEIKKTKDFITFIKSLKDKENFKYIEELHKLSIDNLWFNYFNNLKSKFNTWIDFETEISKVIQILETVKEAKDEALLYNLESFKAHNGIKVLADSLKKTISNEYKKSNQNDNKTCYLHVESYSLVVNKLLEGLNRLTRCLEIYLCVYINSLDTGVRIPEILALQNNINCVLSFNYTNTFERFYGRPNVEYDYIHGKANIENTVETCQLVLGIDEYLDEEEKNKNIDFIQYKKYFQRIYKRTGRKYKDWFKETDTHNRTNGFYTGMKELNIHIIGHSLDITDKDILNELIMFDKQKDLRDVTVPVKVIIYDHNKKANASHIANLVRVITQDELIDSVYSKDGNDPRIVFKPQSPSININDTED